MTRPILLLGIGNILMCDEGVGVRTIEALQKLDLPADVEAIDGGTSGADLIETVAGRRKLVVIDAVDIDAAPGAIVKFGLDDLLEQRVAEWSLHQLGIVETLLMAKQLGCAPTEVVFFGIKPRSLEFSLELSPEIAAKVPKLMELALAECRPATAPGA